MRTNAVVGSVLFFASYPLLFVGLFGWLVEYQHSVQLSADWFKGYPDEATFKQVVGIAGNVNVTVLPRTVRSLLGKGVRERTSPPKSPSSLADIGGFGLPSPASLLGEFSAAVGRGRAGAGARKKAAGFIRREVGYGSSPGFTSQILAMGGNINNDTEEETDGLIMWLLTEYHAGRARAFAPMALIFFGIVIPTIKLITVILYMFCQGGMKKHCAKFASGIARWTAVDAVAEAMVVALLLQSGIEAKHELGYASFVGYVFLSGFGLWLLFEQEVESNCSFCQNPLPGHRRLALYCLPFTLFMFMVLAVLGTHHFQVGKLWIDEAVVASRAREMMEEKGYLTIISFMFSKEKIEDLFQEFGRAFPKPHAETTVVQAVETLLFSGHPYTIAGSVALFFGVLLMPVLQVVLATWVAYYAREAAATGSETPWLPKLRSWLSLVSELSMLDVFVLGIAVGHFVAGSVSGVSTELLHGFYYLLAASFLMLVHVQLCLVVATAELNIEDMDAKMVENHQQK